MTTATLSLRQGQTANPAPPRPGNSVRRTSSMDVFWPDGAGGVALYVGRARDYLTPPAGGPGRVLGQARLEARVRDDKIIAWIEGDPAPADIGDLAGLRVGGQVRKRIIERWPELIGQGTPLYFLLDDMTGAAIVSPTAKIKLDPQWSARMREQWTPEQYDRFRASRIDICWGLAEGSSAVEPGAGMVPSLAEADAGDVRNPLDPEGWHEFPQGEGPNFRRARRIDLWRDGGEIVVSSAFQDSIVTQDGTRGGIHEYLLDARIDAETLKLLSISPEPRILPYPECPGAVHNVQRLVGARIDELRDRVLAEFRGPVGCTHLNDAMRALAEVPILAGYLD